MLDRLVIGTANFGRDYNGHNVSEKEQNLIMEYMKEIGIEWLDVATAYGTENVGKDIFNRIVKTNDLAPKHTMKDIQIAHSLEFYNKLIHSGYSSYSPIETNFPFWREVPYSIMDRRCVDFHIASIPTHTVVRSIFCKGKALKYFSPRECIDFVLMNPRIDKVILGVDSVDQLKENVAHLVKMEKFEHNEEVDTRKF